MEEKQTIVFVDDSPVNLKAGDVMLKNFYNVQLVLSGKDLFELLEKSAKMPNLILLDVVMPEMDGYEVIKKLKADRKTKDIPVIFVSALDDDENELIGLNLGADDYINKPFTAALLQKRVEHQLLMKSLNKELLIAKEQAEAANQAKSDFLARISHEIRTPMNAISGLTEVVRKDNLDRAQIDYLQTIKNMSKILLQIINDTLDLSKIEAGKMELQPNHFLIRKTYEQLCSAYRILVMNKDLRFRSSFDNNLPEALYGDETRIHQMIANVLGNAIKYTKSGFVDLKIKSVIRDSFKWLAIIVEDSGIGIKKEDYGNVFTRFQQLDQGRNRHIQGTGLGLPITLKFAEMMNGTIEFESVYGEGSVFSIYIPLVEGDPDKIEKDIYLETVMAADGVTALVVDDFPVNHTVALGFLQAHNINVETALSGAEALLKIEEKTLAGNEVPYDLIFMDHMMPEMDGLETAAYIRQWEKENSRSKAIPIIALSANAVTGAEEIFLEAGMNDFIPKPINKNQLNRVLAKWLPPEKLVKGYTAPVIEESGDDPLLEEIAKIPGLDCQAGLTNTGNNRKSYYTALRQFCAACDDYLKELQNAFAKDAWKDYSVRVHALKGVLAAFGTDELSKWAYKLEMASKGENSVPTAAALELCRAETVSFCKAIGEFRDSLNGAFDRIDAERRSSEPLPKGDKAALDEQLAELQTACLQGSGSRADKVSAWLGEFDWGDLAEKIKTLRRFIESNDYDIVLDMIKDGSKL